MLKKETERFLKLNLQHFAEETPPADDETNKQTEPAGDPEDDKGTSGTGADKQPGERTFNQEEVNNIATKESRKATEKILKDLGIEDFDNAKEGLQKFREWQDSQKTEAEKLQGDYDKAQQTLQEKETENRTLKAQMSAMKQNVNGDYVEDVVALAERQVTDDVSIDDAIKSVVEKYPHFLEAKESEPEEHKPSFLSGSHNSSSKKNTDPFEAINQKYKR